jgi:hypothetical protein
MKKSNDTFGNRTRDLLACSTIPQIRAQYYIETSQNASWKYSNKRNITTCNIESLFYVTSIGFHCLSASLIFYSLPVT